VNNKRAGEENITYGSYEQDFQLVAECNPVRYSTVSYRKDG